LGYRDGALSDALFKSPKGIAVINGLIYVADDTKIRVIDLTKQTISTIAGGSNAGNKDGVGPDAQFGRLGGLVYDGLNALYATDVYYNLIRKVTIDGLAPEALFTATKKSLSVNEESTLTDISDGKAATSRTWKIVEQTTGATDNVKVVSGDLNSSSSVTVKFLATGFYTVSLDVTNEFGNDKEEKAPYFNVSTVGSVEQLQNLEILNIYPNPVSGNSINLSLEKGVFQDASVELFDPRGSLITSESNIFGSSHTFKLPQIESGTYFLIVRSASFAGAKMIVVE
jgi:PKD repeat protein